MTTDIERQFAKMGARIKLHEREQIGSMAGVSIDIGRDRLGEFYDVSVDNRDDKNLSVLDVRPRIRHLLLSYHRPAVNTNSRFLCGHDERHWFVAAIPETSASSSVRTAMESLKPMAVRRLQERLRVKPQKRNRRRNAAFVRQGEWFFIRIAPSVRIDEWMVLRNEPLRRGNGKPHFVEELIRVGGEAVYVSNQYPQGLTFREYQKLIGRKPELRHLQWVVQRRNPQVFVRGRVRHADHKTIFLDGWHQVLMNTETQSLAMRHVAFID
ncbi:MAG TPA: hypothetical protein VHC22_03825 [Pirellulales bacterium]|nr:hypothetical protein [Pirellulales bacterium]